MYLSKSFGNLHPWALKCSSSCILVYLVQLQAKVGKKGFFSCAIQAMNLFLSSLTFPVYENPDMHFQVQTMIGRGK